MSILSKASLVQIPSGYGEDKLYSQVPNTTAGDFTFTRASTGTRVNADGFIEEVPWNKSGYSEDFSQWTNWVQGAALTPILTTDAVNSPIGTLTADRLQCNQVATGSPNRVGKAFNFSSTESSFGLSQRITLSCWVKSASGSDEDFSLLIRNATLIDATYNLTATNEWQRFELEYETLSFDLSIQVIIGLFQHPTTTTNDIYIWGAQLVKGDSPKPYIKTTDRLNVPRLDYSGGASCPTLLLEPQRTNIVPYTEDFSQWGAINSNRTLINNTNPIDSNAYEIESSVTSSASRIYYSAIMTAGNDYSSTYLVKPSLNSPEYLGFACISNTQPDVLYDFANDQFVDFNIVGNAAKCESISMNNGWKLLKVPVHESVLNTRLNIYQGSRVGNNLYGTTGESYYIKFAQLEPGNYTTSYIPTNGTSVTRTNDRLPSQILATPLTAEGTIFIDFAKIIQGGGDYGFLNLSNQNSYKFYFYGGGMDVYNGSAFIVDRSTLEPNNSKVVVSWNGTDVKVFINGNDRTKSGAVASLNNTEKISFNDSSDICNMNAIILFTEQLTDTELITLTT